VYEGFSPFEPEKTKVEKTKDEVSSDIQQPDFDAYMGQHGLDKEESRIGEPNERAPTVIAILEYAFEGLQG
jgi:hypothetical protein